ncbi:alpha/beta fold hydrolase [Ramlibacter henchirensis]|nr:alpha/beta hydrolase [Ramlibacter henchirensis]
MELPRGGHIRANGIRQHYLHFGKRGPRLVIVPGIVSPAMLWAHVGEWLAACSECFVLDVRGRGLSEAGAHLGYGLDACAQDLSAFVREMKLGPAVVVGHSMGARIAVRAAARTAELYRSLVLLDPPTSGPGRRDYPIPAERTLSLLRAAHRGEAAAAIGSGAGTKWPEQLQRLRAEWLSTCDERAVLAAYEDFHGQDMFGDLARAQVPASLICAGEGGVVSEDDVAEMRRLRRDLDVVRIPGVGHQMQAEDFGAFQRALATVLRRHDQAFERIDQ